MDAVGPHGQGHIDPAVDEEPSPELLGHAPERPGKPGVFIIRQILFPQLHCAHPAGQGGAHHVLQRPAGGLGAVGNQVQGKINGFHGDMGNMQQRSSGRDRARPWVNAASLGSFYPETPDEKQLVSDSERRAFLSRQGNQRIARRRTLVRRTGKPEDLRRLGGKEPFAGRKLAIMPSNGLEAFAYSLRGIRPAL